MPSSVIGPVLLRALRRLASSCLKDVIEGRPRQYWLRFGIWAPFADRPITLGVSLTSAGSGQRGRTFEARIVRSCRQWMRLQPQRPGGNGRIDPDFQPPCGFVAATVDLAMVPAAKRDGELIADLAD